MTRGTRLVTLEDRNYLVSTDPFLALVVDNRAVGALRQCDAYATVDALLSACPATSRATLTAFLDALVARGLAEMQCVFDDESRPTVSIIIPIWNRPDQLVDCVQSILALDYPRDRMELIVVDDASDDSTPDVASQLPVTLLRMEKRQGPAACRNAGSFLAKGSVLAFVDSDCVVDSMWLEKLVPYLEVASVAAVGGAVISLYRRTALEKYEDVMSPLYMGDTPAEVRVDTALPYVPSCNMVLKASVFAGVGCMDAALQLGEDVDLCYRIQEAGYRIRYEPSGVVHHRHRTKFFAFLKRRFDYGTSEALLWSKHPTRRRVLYLPVLKYAVLAVLLAGILGVPAWICGLAILPLAADAGLRYVRLRKAGLRFHFGLVGHSVLYDWQSFINHLLTTATHYNTLLFLPAVPFYPAVGAIILALHLLAALIEYTPPRASRVPLPAFLFFHLMEHIAYQIGVFVGCGRHSTLRPLISRIRIC